MHRPGHFRRLWPPRGQKPVFACIPVEYVEPGSSFEIELQGERRKAVVLADPAYDPTNAKQKA
jgi:glycine cleavage system aminomethyltransferase T